MNSKEKHVVKVTTVMGTRSLEIFHRFIMSQHVTEGEIMFNFEKVTDLKKISAYRCKFM